MYKKLKYLIRLEHLQLKEKWKLFCYLQLNLHQKTAPPYPHKSQSLLTQGKDRYYR